MPHAKQPLCEPSPRIERFATLAVHASGTLRRASGTAASGCGVGSARATATEGA